MFGTEPIFTGGCCPWTLLQPRSVAFEFIPNFHQHIYLIKAVVLAHRPPISIPRTTVAPALLEELLGEIGSLASVYHKPSETFIGKGRIGADAVRKAGEYVFFHACRTGLAFLPSINFKRQGGLVKMMYFIGLGLADEKDITLKGLEIVKSAERVYLEMYTAVLLVDQAKLVSAEPLLSS